MKLIPLERVQNMICLLPQDEHDFMFSELMELETIDPISTIDEMIEDLLGKWGSIPEIAKNTHQMEVLQALKSRLYPLTQKWAMTDFIIFILDKINQFFCSHQKRWQTSQEIKRKARAYWDTLTCSAFTMVTTEIHCNKCGKKWFKNTFE